MTTEAQPAAHFTLEEHLIVFNPEGVDIPARVVLVSGDRARVALATEPSTFMTLHASHRGRTWKREHDVIIEDAHERIDAAQLRRDLGITPEIERDHARRNERMLDVLQAEMIANNCGELASKIAEMMLAGQQWTYVVSTLRTHGLSIDVMQAQTVPVDELCKNAPLQSERTDQPCMWSWIVSNLEHAGYRIVRKGAG